MAETPPINTTIPLKIFKNKNLFPNNDHLDSMNNKDKNGTPYTAVLIMYLPFHGS